ncbi:hypothetical protein J7L29_06460 [Candidatus Bathyarchaeota archaeon]|nr:hypothetical protein [Candidatus Bathyarchaeota archaeon]
MGWKKNLALAFCVILVLSFTGYVSYKYGYRLGYARGYEAGFTDGNIDGYQRGYSEGNETGYQTGYKAGYNYGYSHGYDEGYNLGYNNGYSKGYNDGNLTGYQTGYQIGYESGFDDGYLKGVEDGAGRGYTIRDPTFQEVLNFIRIDKTDRNKYSENYTCINFAADVKNNAFKAGYRCGLVYIRFPETAHTIVAFNTTDKGIIFIEPQFDDIVILEIGKSYSKLNGYREPPYDDTILYYIIIW